MFFMLYINCRLLSPSGSAMAEDGGSGRSLPEFSRWGKETAENTHKTTLTLHYVLKTPNQDLPPHVTVMPSTAENNRNQATIRGVKLIAKLREKGAVLTEDQESLIKKGGFVVSIAVISPTNIW